MFTFTRCSLFSPPLDQSAAQLWRLEVTISLGLDPSHLGVAAYVVLQQDYRSTADGWTIYSHSTHGLPVNLAGN